MWADASACVFRHADRRLVASVHGDDFTELTENGRLGPSTDDDKDVKILNRIARWTARGLEYEADPQQAERLASDLRLDDAKRVGTPGVKQTFEITSRDKPLAVEKRTAFRAIAATGTDACPHPSSEYKPFKS